MNGVLGELVIHMHVGYPAHDPCVPVWMTVRALWEGGAWPAHGERDDHDRRQAHKEPLRNRNSHLKEDGGWRTDR